MHKYFPIFKRTREIGTLMANWYEEKSDSFIVYYRRSSECGFSFNFWNNNFWSFAILFQCIWSSLPIEF